MAGTGKAPARRGLAFCAPGDFESDLNQPHQRVPRGHFQRLALSQFLGLLFLTAWINWEPTHDFGLARLLEGFAIAVLLARVALEFTSEDLARVKAAKLPIRTAPVRFR